MRVIPYGRQDIDESDIKIVVETLKSDFLTQGPMIDRFEQSIADICGAKHVVAVNSATSALHIACMALDLGLGDQLWTTPNTFVASANCGLYCGATVDFVDTDPRTYNLSPVALEAKLKASSVIPKVVIPVHLTGQPADMAPIHALSERYGFKVIEDASHAIGAEYQGTSTGDSSFSDMTVFSFHPVKIATSAEGGAIATNNDDYARRLRLHRTHGITRDPSQMESASDGPWYYEQVTMGYNYRITDLQSALGVSQLARLDRFLERRRELARQYDALLADLPLTLPYQLERTNSSWHLYVIRLKLDQIKKSKREVFEQLRSAGILVNLHYIPVHYHPVYRKLGFTKGQFPEAEKYYEEAISIPLYYGLSDEDQKFVVDEIRRALD